jgi:cell cycle sensor histidine kinase DivJ
MTELIGWHVGWAIAVVAGAVITAGAAHGLTPDAAGALVLGLVPAGASLVLLSIDGKLWRTLLLVLWAVCGALACGLSGGLGGPMAAWCLAPIAAAGVLARTDLLSRAAALSLAAVGVTALAGVAGLTPEAPTGRLALGLGALSLVTVVVGLGAGLVLARRRARLVVSAQGAEVETLAAVLDRLPCLVLYLLPSGRVERTFGRALGKATLRGLEFSLIDAARPEDRPKVRDAINTALASGKAETLFVSGQSLDRILCLDLRALADRRLVGVLRDVTDDQARMETLEAARADAEAMAAGKTQFLAGMSHELRTPLNAIMGFSDIMRNRMFGDLPGKYVEYADLIHESGSHLLDLINDILDMSKIEARRYELTLEAMDPREPVAAALRILRLQADDLGVVLRASLPAAAPDVEADRRALKQIVLNLVSNALKFTPKGGSVTVTLAAHGKDLELTVADTGVGIAQADLEKLGRPYEQVGDADKRAQGTGLGLSLVRSFAELHGGEMTIESRLGEGTAVTVRLPVVHESRPTPTGDNVVAFTPQR